MVLQNSILIIILERSELIHNSLPIEKILSFHNVLILIKSAVDKKKSKYYYSIFLEKGLDKDK